MRPPDTAAVQDQMRDNFCWGCGADNPDGLQLKSWSDGDTLVAEWTPRAEYAAGPRHILNGGIIATLLDCQSVCTAIAAAYGRENRAISSEPEIWCATASMTVEFLRPAPLEAVLTLVAREIDYDERNSTVECTLAADGKDRARSSVRAVRVPESWRHGSRTP